MRATVSAANVLARTALDLLTDDELSDAPRADFERRTEGYEYMSPIPDRQEAPRGLRLPVAPP